MLIKPYHFQSELTELSEYFDITASQLTRWAKQRPMTAKMFDLAYLALESHQPEAIEVFQKKSGTDHRELGAIVGFRENIYYMDGICPVVGTTLRTWYSQEGKWPMFCGAVVGTHCLVCEELASHLQLPLNDIINHLGLSRADVVALFLERPQATIILLNSVTI